MKNVDIQVQGLSALRSDAWSAESPVEDDTVSASGVVASGAMASQAVEKRGSWPMTGMTDSEAAKTLSGVDSGFMPDLSRCGYRTLKRAFDICVAGGGYCIITRSRHLAFDCYLR